MAIPLQSSGNSKYVDFNYPDNVTKNALADLDKALKTGDGELTVDALIRYSIAYSSLSQENIGDIVERIENVINKEKQPHIKALLRYFEASVYSAYRNRYAYGRNRNNPVGEEPTDVSEWDSKQFDAKIMSLLAQSLEDREALKQVEVTSLPDIITCNELGATYVPTLLEFLSMKNIEDLKSIRTAEFMIRDIKEQWIKDTEGNAPAHIHAICSNNAYVDKEEFDKYKDSEYCALLFEHTSFGDEKEKYKALQEYVSRFPNTYFTADVKNMITKIEKKRVSTSYPGQRQSTDSIPVTLDVYNVNKFNLKAFCVSKEDLDHSKIGTKNLKLQWQQPVQVEGTTPFTKRVEVNLPPLPYGAYLIVAEDLDGQEDTDNETYGSNAVLVTDISLITINHYTGKDRIGAVNTKTGKPLPGVTITHSEGTVGTTDSNGLVYTPKEYYSTRYKKNVEFDNVRVYGSKGDDTFGPEKYFSKIRESNRTDFDAVIYTDLGVYRPGETVKWAAFIYHESNSGRTPQVENNMMVIFKDSNNEPIDTVIAKTDDYGRIEGTFVVPKDRMNGEFSITMDWAHNSGRYSYLARKYINVSEYKTPTFEVSFPDARRSYISGQPVKITGKAETYSGVPVANAEVRLSLIKSQWTWWWWRMNVSEGEHLMDTTVVTDGKGNFTFEFPEKVFNENRYSSQYRWARYNYSVKATVTTDAGETQEESTSFIVGTRRGIELGTMNDDTYLIDKPIKLPLIYNTTDEEKTSVWCSWEIVPIEDYEPVKTGPVKTGTVNTDDPTFDLTDLPSGQYVIKIRILDADPGEVDAAIEGYLTLYRKTDKVPPIKDVPLWISPINQTVDKNNVGHVTIGVSTPRAYIYYIAATTDKVIGEGWLNYVKGMHEFTVPLPKEAGADVTVEFVTCYDNSPRYESIRLANPYKAEALKITATSFRDKLTPGDIEHWTFTLTDQNGKPRPGAMLLEMFDKAISTITPNNWSYTNWQPSGLAGRLNIQWERSHKYTSSEWMGKMVTNNDHNIAFLPDLYTYHQTLFGLRMSIDENRSGRPSRGLGATAERGRPMESPTYDAMKSDATFGGDAVMKYSEDASEEAVEVNERDLEKVVLRENDVKTALWQPMLNSDAKGNIKLEFEVPNFNTTWITQAVAWDENMIGSTWMAEVLTQKPLMVKSNMPRFLRQGDKATLAAMVQNATDAAATCDAVIELFDPRTEEVYATRKFNLQLDPKGSQAVTIDWQVLDTISFVGFRIKAANGRYGDGEQVMVPVLTTISPVIETAPFYVEAGENHFEVALPDFPKDARVTLEYCDNPVWYSVLALPTIFSNSYHISSHAAHSLFALLVAQGVAKDQPQIKEAVTYWKQHEEDSTLVSMLQKNQDLKIGTLLASPWMRDADRQTLRMSKLNELFDDDIASKQYEKIIEALQSLQMSDGGFTWFLYPECHSEYWVTGTVLELLGNIKHLGYLPDDKRLTSMLNRALDYYDRHSVMMLNECRNYNKSPYEHFISYAYVRSMYPEVKVDKGASNLMKNTLKYMDKSWKKGLTLREKAFYAMTLYRGGHEKTARDIVESIRQFAIVKPNLGMYWDNLQTGYGWWELDKVAYTCTVLRAMNEVDPRQEEIDQIRKWMLLMKQSNDWGSYSLAADAVYSILRTGSHWLDRGATPTITVAGQPVNLDKMAEYLGYFRTTLDASTTGNVVIDRTAKGPAWGSVYSQFKAPMTQIKEKAIDEISISKEYYVYAQDGTLHPATSFKVGDKVKVRVIIKLNKDMDYVTMTDERAACFEPVDQLSGYKYEDRTGFYLETKDTQTNAFFSSLSKGTHIIGYDVWVTNPGEFTSGIATIQCQYAPQLSAHSAGKTITAHEK